MIIPNSVLRNQESKQVTLAKRNNTWHLTLTQQNSGSILWGKVNLFLSFHSSLRKRNCQCGMKNHPYELQASFAFSQAGSLMTMTDGQCIEQMCIPHPPQTHGQWDRRHTKLEWRHLTSQQEKSKFKWGKGLFVDVMLQQSPPCPEALK